MLRLQLRWEHVGLSSGLGLVDRANVYALLFLVTHYHCSAQYDWDNTEVLLWLTLFEAVVRIPPCTFDLQSKDISSVTLGGSIDLPVHLLLDVGLNVQLVEFESLLTGCDLLDSCQE